MKASLTVVVRCGVVAALILLFLTTAGPPILGQAAAAPEPLLESDSWPDPIGATLPGLQTPNGLAVNGFTNRLYITSRGNNSVLMVDATTLTQLAKTTLVGASQPFGVAINTGTDKVYVANFNSGNLSVLRGSDLQLLKTVNLGAGTQPTAVATMPGSNLVIVALHGQHQFVVLDGATDQIIHYVAPDARSPWGLAVDDEYDLIFISFRDSGTVQVFDPEHSLPHSSVLPCGPAPGTPFGLAYDGAERQLYVACGHGQYSVDTAVTYSVSTVGALTEVGRVALDQGGANGGGGVAVVPFTGHAFFTNSQSKTVSMIGANSWRLANFPLGVDPFALAVDPLTWRVYVGDRAGNRLYAFYDRLGAGVCRNALLAAPQLAAAGEDPGAVALGDFNNDGKLDAAVNVNVTWGGSTSSVALLLGHGDGVLSVPMTYRVGRGAAAIATSDFDGDHRLDLVVANYGSGDALHPGNVSVLLGNGDGTVGTAVNYEVGYGPDSVAVGDFNGDKAPDLAVANAGVGNQVSVLLGRGDGTFKTAVNYYSGVQPMAVVTADFNRDGRLDLAVANWGPSDDDGSVILLLGAGDGTFPTRMHLTSYFKPGSLVVGDFDSNGNPDLVAVDSFLSYTHVLLGQGGGTFTEAISFAGRPTARADFNGDGRPDLAGALGSNVGLWLGSGDGTFHLAGSFAAGGEPGGMAIGDFNGDGRPDLATSIGADIPGFNGKLSVLLHKCTWVVCLPMIAR